MGILCTWWVPLVVFWPYSVRYSDTLLTFTLLIQILLYSDYYWLMKYIEITTVVYMCYIMIPRCIVIHSDGKRRYCLYDILLFFLMIHSDYSLWWLFSWFVIFWWCDSVLIRYDDDVTLFCYWWWWYSIILWWWCIWYVVMSTYYWYILIPLYEWYIWWYRYIWWYTTMSVLWYSLVPDVYLRSYTFYLMICTCYSFLRLFIDIWWYIHSLLILFSICSRDGNSLCSVLFWWSCTIYSTYILIDVFCRWCHYLIHSMMMFWYHWPLPLYITTLPWYSVFTDMICRCWYNTLHTIPLMMCLMMWWRLFLWEHLFIIRYYVCYYVLRYVIHSDKYCYIIIDDDIIIIDDLYDVTLCSINVRWRILYMTILPVLMTVLYIVIYDRNKYLLFICLVLLFWYLFYTVWYSILLLLTCHYYSIIVLYSIHYVYIVIYWYSIVEVQLLRIYLF